MISQTDLELLNAYLDGALDEQQRAELESRLASEPTLRHELDALRATVGLVRALPRLRAPRNFTLTETDARRARTIAFPAAAISFVSAAASILLIVIGVALLNPASQMSQTVQTAAESRTVELDDVSDGSQAVDAAVAALPTASKMPTQQPTQSPPTIAALSGDAAAAPPAPVDVQENAVEMTAVQDGEIFDSVATVMLEEVQAQATQVAGRMASETNAAPMQDALAQPQQSPAIAGGMIAPSDTATQVALYGMGADAYASEVSPPGYIEPAAVDPLLLTATPAGTSFMFSREDEHQTTDALESAVLITETASPTVTPSVSPSPMASATLLPTATIQPTLVNEAISRDERQQQETQMPTGAILIGIGMALGIFAVVYFIRARW